MIQFETAVQALCDAGVDFVVVGGLSAIFHGSVGVTFDLHICYSRTGANLRKLAAALPPFHPRLRGLPGELPFIWDEHTLRNGTIFTLQTDICEIDLLAEVSGIGDFSSAITHSVQVEGFDRQIKTLTLAALIQAKRSAGREEDLAVLPELKVSSKQANLSLEESLTDSDVARLR